MVRKKGGITLIALVISIIVLILLAAIVISTLNGEMDFLLRQIQQIIIRQ